MNVVHIACVVLVGAISVNCQGIFHGRVDCAYNTWSEFRPSTNYPDQVVRTRQIIRYARNGGDPCTGSTYQYRKVTDLQTPSLSKFLSMFIPGNKRKVALGGSLLGRGQVPQTYTLTRDIALIIDTSLFASAIPLYKSLLSNLVGSVCGDVGRDQSTNMFSLITFDSYQAQVIHSFNDEQNKVALQNSILRIQPTNGSRENPSLMKDAMNKASAQISGFDTGTRNANLAHKDAVLFVTYRSLCEKGYNYAGRQLRINGVLYVVVLGQSGDGTEPPSDWCLREIASKQFDFHFLWVKNYQDLKDFASWALDITSYYNACDDSSNQGTKGF